MRRENTPEVLSKRILNACYYVFSYESILNSSPAVVKYDQIRSARKGLPDRVKEAGRGRSDCKDDMRSIPPPPGVIFALPLKTPSNSCFEGFLLLLCSRFALACSPLADIHSSVYFSAPFRLAFCSLSRSVFQGKYRAARFYSRAWQWPRTLHHC